MALVICCVFFTDRMRRRRSIRFGISVCRGPLVLRDEALLELRQRVFDLLAQGIVENLLLADLVEHGAGLPVQVSVERLFKHAALRYGEIVQKEKQLTDEAEKLLKEAVAEYKQTFKAAA